MNGGEKKKSKLSDKFINETKKLKEDKKQVRAGMDKVIQNMF